MARGKPFGGKQAPPFGKGKAKAKGKAPAKESATMEREEMRGMSKAMRARHNQMMKGD